MTMLKCIGLAAIVVLTCWSGVSAQQVPGFGATPVCLDFHHPCGTPMLPLAVGSVSAPLLTTEPTAAGAKKGAAIGAFVGGVAGLVTFVWASQAFDCTPSQYVTCDAHEGRAFVILVGGGAVAGAIVGALIGSAQPTNSFVAVGLHRRSLAVAVSFRP